VPKKLARLFLVSDILHNSSAAVPKAASYRTRFQSTLPSIFSSLHVAFVALESRMATETFKEQVTKVLHIWQAWSLFPLSFTTKLERLFLHGVETQPPPAASATAPPSKVGGAAATTTAKSAPATASAAGGEASDDSEDLDGEPMTLDGELNANTPAARGSVGDAAANAAAAEKEKREARIRAFNLRELEAVCEASGVSSAGSRSEMLARLIAALRGGIAIELDAKPAEQQTLAVASRWDDDEEEDGASNSRAAGASTTAPSASADDAPDAMKAAAIALDDIDGQTIDGEDLDGQPIDAPPATVGQSDGALGSGGRGGRAKEDESQLSKETLRDVEVAVMRLTDKLEADGLAPDAIAARASEHRRTLVEKALQASVHGGGQRDGRKERDKERPKERDAERERRERPEGRDKDGRDKDREQRDREASRRPKASRDDERRERERSDRDRRSSRSRSRERERERSDRDRRPSRSRSRERLRRR